MNVYIRFQMRANKPRLCCVTTTCARSYILSYNMKSINRKMTVYRHVQWLCSMLILEKVTNLMHLCIGEWLEVSVFSSGRLSLCMRWYGCLQSFLRDSVSWKCADPEVMADCCQLPSLQSEWYAAVWICPWQRNTKWWWKGWGSNQWWLCTSTPAWFVAAGASSASAWSMFAVVLSWWKRRLSAPTWGQVWSWSPGGGNGPQCELHWVTRWLISHLWPGSSPLEITDWHDAILKIEEDIKPAVGTIN